LSARDQAHDGRICRFASYREFDQKSIAIDLTVTIFLGEMIIFALNDHFVVEIRAEPSYLLPNV